MKYKSFLIIALVSILSVTESNTLIAQPIKGSWLTEGSIGNVSYVNNKSTGNVITNQNLNFLISPAMGYFISDKFIIGTSFNYNYQSSVSVMYQSRIGPKANETATTYKSIGFGPFLRYYFLTSKNLKNKFYLQIGGGINYILLSENKRTNYSNNGSFVRSDEVSSHGKVLFGSGLLGFNHFFSENVAINTALGYYYNKNDETLQFISTYGGNTATSPEAKYASVTTTIAWYLGFTIIIPHKKE